MSEDRILKRAVIREELVALTGDYIAAIVLNQFLYWSKRRRDFDKFIKEEQERDPTAKMAPTHGWIYKSTEELRDEIMVTVSDSTVRRRIKELVEKGWLRERRNPRLKWDRTLQYRPDIYRIQRDLWKLGYPLADYPLQYTEADFLDDECILQGEESKPRGEKSKPPSDGTIPEITSEIPSEVTAEDISSPATTQAQRIAEQSKEFDGLAGEDALDAAFGPRGNGNEPQPRQKHEDPRAELAESYAKSLSRDRETPAEAVTEAFLKSEGTELSETKRKSLVAHFARIIENSGGATKAQAVLAWKSWRKANKWRETVNPRWENFELEYALELGKVKKGTVTERDVMDAAAKAKQQHRAVQRRINDSPELMWARQGAAPRRMR